MKKSESQSFVEKKVTYSLEFGGKFFIIENVPARIDPETGEQLFSPKVVEQLQKIILQKKTPSRVIETPVFEFAD